MSEIVTNEGSSIELPPSNDIRNKYNTAEVLQKIKNYEKAIEKYFEVCWDIEKILKFNISAGVDFYLPMFSIGKISDIFEEREEYKKSLIFRQIQNSFLVILKQKKDIDDRIRNGDDIDIELADVSSITYDILNIFKQLRQAHDNINNSEYDSPQQLAKRINEAYQKDQQRKIEEFTRLLEKENEEREKKIKSSFWRRNVYDMLDNPVKFIIFLFFFAVFVMILLALRPRKKIKNPLSKDASFEYLEKYVKNFEKNNPEKAKLNEEKREQIKKKYYPKHEDNYFQNDI